MVNEKIEFNPPDLKVLAKAKKCKKSLIWKALQPLKKDSV